MAAPVLANRSVCFVNKVGTDDAGYNAVGAPQPRLTIAAALADLAANYPAASATNPHVVAIGPGVFTEAGFALPPHTWIAGAMDGNGMSSTVLQISSDITLGAGWSINTTAQGGFGQLVIRAASGTPALDLTMPTPLAGNPSRLVELQNIVTDLELINFEATGSGDALRVDNVVQDGSLADDITILGGIVALNQLQTAAEVELESGAVRALASRITASQIPQITVTKGVAACAVAFDAVSWPLIADVTLTNAPALTRLSDANAEGYTPAVPGDWSTIPTTVQGALDELAASGGGGGGGSVGALAVTNNAGNTTITPTAKVWTQYMTFTGAAGTRIMILSVATPPVLGDRIKLFMTRADGGGIIVTARNATAGGTLLGTFADGTGSDTACFEFVYGTIAGGFAADAWLPINYAIPATT